MPRSQDTGQRAIWGREKHQEREPRIPLTIPGSARSRGDDEPELPRPSPRGGACGGRRRHSRRGAGEPAVADGGGEEGEAWGRGAGGGEDEALHAAGAGPRGALRRSVTLFCARSLALGFIACVARLSFCSRGEVSARGERESERQRRVIRMTMDDETKAPRLVVGSVLGPRCEVGPAGWF